MISNNCSDPYPTFLLTPSLWQYFWEEGGGGANLVHTEFREEKTAQTLVEGRQLHWDSRCAKSSLLLLDHMQACFGLDLEWLLYVLGTIKGLNYGQISALVASRAKETLPGWPWKPPVISPVQVMDSSPLFLTPPPPLPIPLQSALDLWMVHTSAGYKQVGDWILSSCHPQTQLGMKRN